MATQKDISKMTDAEIKEYLRQRKAEATKRATPEMRAEVEKYVQEKYGVSLAAVFTASKHPSLTAGTYKNPNTGEVYTYSGKGIVPAWLKDTAGKPNQEYRQRSN